jgi:predicted DNA-binding transcriptional regulator YafY
MNRLFEIVYVLMSKERVTARELSERFEVSQRTIYRDIDALSVAGIPVYTEKGKCGGISLLPDYTLNRSVLTEDEQNEIIQALQAIEAVKPGETSKALTKLSALFNRKFMHWIDVDFSDWSYKSRNVFNILKQAILSQKIVSFDYYSSKGEKTHRSIEPMQLHFKHRSWYVKGYCLSRQDERMFKLTRIDNLVMTENTFSKRDIPSSPQETSQEEEASENIKLKLKVAPEMTYRVYDEFGPENIEKLPDGYLVATGYYTEDEWVYGLIMSFGEYTEVLEPGHVREIIKKRLAKAMEIYK